MWNEHFGIGVVELMAAGVVTVAHNSGGPRADIVTGTDSDATRCGYLASTVDEYAAALRTVFARYFSTHAADHAFIRAVTARARKQAARFSDAAFVARFTSCFRPLLLQQLSHKSY
jgi:alpha-1,2-mannosyltransferase